MAQSDQNEEKKKKKKTTLFGGVKEGNVCRRKMRHSSYRKLPYAYQYTFFCFQPSVKVRLNANHSVSFCGLCKLHGPGVAVG